MPPNGPEPAPGTLLVADHWSDFELLDCGDGLKKERWGEVILVRPDPQAIWPPENADWKPWDAFYHRSSRGGGRWEFARSLPEHWVIRRGPLAFRVRPTGFKHTGLFPEQAVNWDWFSALIRGAGRPVSVLNLFGYTGGATIAAAAAGASVCHVDAAKGMVAWCRDNATESGLADAPIRTIVDDCLKFVEREARRERRYDAVIMDPPSFGRGRQGEVWQIESHLWPLLQACRGLLSDRPLFFLINAYTAGLSPVILANLLRRLLGNLPGAVSWGEVGLPATRSGLVLPCGIFARWQAG
ncbi:MAG: SAM-dependent methyltransferase [Puniceicoccaceae bacterium]|nr:MAG: SAM-dependent methyltransferase [Puniceicoccaceae bacterium]